MGEGGEDVADLRQLLEAIDTLSQEELDLLDTRIQQRLRHEGWIVLPEALAEIDGMMKPVQEQAAEMDEAEVNAAIDQAVAEARRERQAQSRL
jgi:hypothetical protein